MKSGGVAGVRGLGELGVGEGEGEGEREREGEGEGEEWLV